MTRVQQTAAATLFIAVLILGGWAWSQDENVTSPSDLNPALNGPPSVEPVQGNDTSPATAPVESAPGSDGDRRQVVIFSLWIFGLALFVGILVISKVPPTLHTPLMSGSNAISGITLVGAVIVAAAMVNGLSPSAGIFARFCGFIAVTLAMVNAVGGFMVTHRMLAMFARK